MEHNRRDFLSIGAAAITAAAQLQRRSTTSPGPLSPARSAPQQAELTASELAARGNPPTEVKKIEVHNLPELEPAAQKVLSQQRFYYISSAQGDQWTKFENERAYKRFTLNPKYMVGSTEVDLTCSLLGSKISMPIISSVTSNHGMVHSTAEVGTARGADAAKTLFIAPALSQRSMEEIAQASSGPKWFQLYMPVDQGQAKELLQRAKAAGYLAVMLSIDGGRPSVSWGLPNGNVKGGKSIATRNLPTWDDVAFIQEVTGLPVILKGVMSPELAVMAIEHGCAAIEVSNHGGKVLYRLPATITVLPHIAEAVAERIPIIIDGGIRWAEEVFIALALGATAVAVGRPILYGLALGGWMGVQAVLEYLKTELQMTMRFAGTKSIGEISKHYVNI